MKVIICNQFTEHAVSNSRKNSDKTTANHCRQSLHNCLHVRLLFNCSVCIVLHMKSNQIPNLAPTIAVLASTVLALSRARRDLIMAPHVELLFCDLRIGTFSNRIALNFKSNPNRIVYVQIKSFTTRIKSI